MDHFLLHEGDGDVSLWMLMCVGSRWWMGLLNAWSTFSSKDPRLSNNQILRASGSKWSQWAIGTKEQAWQSSLHASPLCISLFDRPHSTLWALEGMVLLPTCLVSSYSFFRDSVPLWGLCRAWTFYHSASASPGLRWNGFQLSCIFFIILWLSIGKGR